MSSRILRALITSALMLNVVACPKPGPAYFVIGEREPFHGDSYVIMLTDPGDIAHARALIRRPDQTESPILVAAIERGPGDLPNQDYLNGGAPWSWHVSEFQGFADFTIEILDGWPTYVEENLDDWFANTGGHIGFWTYTVVREVSLEDLRPAP
jgi:hypothetical protein